jgi:hypothetical protein
MQYGPKIVTNGLLSALDAADLNSYSPNVYPNPIDLLAWVYMGSGNQCTLSRDTTITRQYGSVPMKMIVTGNDPYTAHNTFNQNLASALSGQTWTVSIYAKASVNTTGQIFIYGADVTGSVYNSPDYAAGTLSITTSWQRFSFSYTLTNTYTRYVQFRLDGPDTGGAGINIWWDSVQVERSSAATTFNPYYYGDAVWRDFSGNANSFVINNLPTYSNNSFVLNGSTQYASITTTSGFFTYSTNNFYADVGYAWTVSAWFKFPISPTTTRNSANNGGNCSYCIVGDGGGIGGAETLALFVSGGDATTSAGSLAPYYCVVGIRGSKTQLSIGSVNTNTWNHVVITWNGSAGRGYFNGVDKGALNIGVQGMQAGYAPTIGTTAGGNQGNHTFEGSISQVLFYNRALSATESLQLYNASKARFGL